MLQISLFTRLTRRCIATLLAPRFALPLLVLPRLPVSQGAAAKDLVDVPVGINAILNPFRLSAADSVYPEQQVAVIMYSPVFMQKYPEAVHLSFVDDVISQWSEYQ